MPNLDKTTMRRMRIVLMTSDKRKPKQKQREDQDWLEFMQEESLMLKKLNILINFHFISHSHCQHHILHNLVKMMRRMRIALMILDKKMMRLKLKEDQD